LSSTTRTVTSGRARQHPQHFEAAQVRTEQQDAAAGIQVRMQRLQSFDPHREAPQLPRQQEHAVEDGRGEGVDVAGDVEQRRRALQHAREVGARGAPFRAAPQQEIQRDRIQQRARHGAAAVTADAADQPDREPAAAFRALLPLHGPTAGRSGLR
jgi:hypothetical protein